MKQMLVLPLLFQECKNLGLGSVTNLLELVKFQIWDDLTPKPVGVVFYFYFLIFTQVYVY